MMIRTTLFSTAAALLVSGAAHAEILNGGFTDGADHWNLFGGHGLFDYSADGFEGIEGNGLAAWGAYDGAGYSGAAQDINGTWNAGDTIEFGADWYVPNPDPLHGDNHGFIALNFFGADGGWWFNVVSPLIDHAPGTSGSHSLSYTLDEGAAGAARIEFVMIFRQPENHGGPSGAVIYDNAFANIVPTPGALALLGIAGLGMRRRRA
ncbi:MAG: hypothetical protein CMJ32_07740 [Phycisphaerae bacterium]|nr:hypothetical protein [Phycisphaerae bacterium]